MHLFVFFSVSPLFSSNRSLHPGSIEGKSNPVSDFDEENDDESDDEEELVYDYVCAFCDNGGDILPREGKCMRSFHPTIDAGVDTSCQSLGFENAVQYIFPLQKDYGMKYCPSEEGVDFFLSRYVFRLKIFHERGLDLINGQCKKKKSLNWQHQLCKNPRPNPGIKTLFIDHTCASNNGGQATAPANSSLSGPVPKAGVFPPIGAHGTSLVSVLAAPCDILLPSPPPNFLFLLLLVYDTRFSIQPKQEKKHSKIHPFLQLAESQKHRQTTDEEARIPTQKGFVFSFNIKEGSRSPLRPNLQTNMEYQANYSIWDGLYYHPHLFGGIMLTAALLGLSTSYLSGIAGFPTLPYMLPYLGNFQKQKTNKKRIRVYMDGCFDLMHYGHANALRQAKALGDELVVGIVSDEEIIKNKGPPVLSMEERLALVSGLKWVDEVIANAPYAITEDFMNSLFKEHKIDYIIHGDDPCLLPDGSDAYALAKKVGRYKQIKRTEGVSSTDIVGRILASMEDKEVCEVNGESNEMNKSLDSHFKSKHASNFLPTSRRIVQFSNGKGPGPNARVVYIDGAFDLFHAGHVEILKSARQLGDFLLVGIYTDQTVSQQRGAHFPLMHLHERSLSVLGCRYVDEVIIGAPFQITKDMIATFNISIVVHGTVSESDSSLNGTVDPYSVPKSMGIFRTLESPKNITTTSVAQRIKANHEIYEKRNAKKEASEKKFYEERKYISGD
ncbi:hypothetical protein L1887_02705 [Cichorium endivia]|nr:hypothetical protein L1887_02705 [Cichorium endivia]